MGELRRSLCQVFQVFLSITTPCMWYKLGRERKIYELITRGKTKFLCACHVADK